MSVRVAAFACCAALLCAGTAQAQTPTPAPASTPSGYVGKGDILVQTQLTGAPLTVRGEIALEERGERVRIDVLSLTLPGASAGAAALSPLALFPPGGFTIVFDAGAGTFTAWFASRKTYFVAGPFKPALPHTVAPSPSPSPAVGAPATTGDLFSVFNALRSIKDDRTLSLSIAMNGHTTLFGHASTGITYEMIREPLTGNGGENVHGEIDFADDLGEIPLRFTSSVGIAGIPSTSLTIELPSLERALPDVRDFAPPPGFTRENTPNFGGMLQH